jgi:hypothetical protein
LKMGRSKFKERVYSSGIFNQQANYSNILPPVALFNGAKAFFTTSGTVSDKLTAAASAGLIHISLEDGTVKIQGTSVKDLAGHVSNVVLTTGEAAAGATMDIYFGLAPLQSLAEGWVLGAAGELGTNIGTAGAIRGLGQATLTSGAKIAEMKLFMEPIAMPVIGQVATSAIQGATSIVDRLAPGLGLSKAGCVLSDGQIVDQKKVVKAKEPERPAPVRVIIPKVAIVEIEKPKIMTKPQDVEPNSEIEPDRTIVDESLIIPIEYLRNDWWPMIING